MFVQVIVKTKSSSQKIEELDNGNLLVYVSSAPENNEANKEVISLLSKHYRVHWKTIKIKSGLKSKKKLVLIN